MSTVAIASPGNPWNQPVAITVGVQKDIRNKAFINWRKRTACKIPLLSRRVFDLRLKQHPAVQWDLERRLGSVIESLNSDSGSLFCGPDAWRRQSVMMLTVQELYRDVREAEHAAVSR